MSTSEVPAGIGGWLLIPIVTLFVSIYAAVGSFQEIGTILGPNLWTAFKTPGTVFYHSPWVPVIVVGALIQVSIVIIAVIAMTAIFRKKKSVPRIMILLYVLGTCLVIVDMFLTYSFLASISPQLSNQVAPESLKKMAGVIVSAIIWMPYFLKSKRVMNTFVNE